MRRMKDWKRNCNGFLHLPAAAMVAIGALTRLGFRNWLWTGLEMSWLIAEENFASLLGCKDEAKKIENYLGPNGTSISQEPNLSESICRL